jgi:predicted alpha/beta hydrolase
VTDLTRDNPTGQVQDWVDRGTDRIALHRYPAPDDPAAPAVVVWPAMGVPARYYRPFARELVGAGLAVVVADLRGTGDSTPAASRRSRYGLAALVEDVGAVQQALDSTVDGRRTLLVGHSLGGQAALLHCALAAPSESSRGGTWAGSAGRRSTVDALVLVGVGLPYFRAYPGRRAASVLAMTQSIVAATELVGVWPGWGFGGRQARGVIRDWGYTARHGRYPALGGMDVEVALGRLSTPVLAVDVAHDNLIPPSTVDHLAAKLRTAPLTREHYAVADERLDHFRWVRASGPLAERIARYAEGLSG